MIAPSQDTAVFDHVSRSGSWPGGTWTGDAIGAADGGTGGYHQASGRFTVTGSGDIAPVVPGPAVGIPAPPSRSTSSARSPG